MKHFNDGLIAFLKNATTKLEELQLQTSLGKAEVTDKVDELKKEGQERLNEFKLGFKAIAKKSDEYTDLIKAKMEYLELQFALGKADTTDELNAQKKKIQEALRELKELAEKVI